MLNAPIIQEIYENPIKLGHMLGYDKLAEHHNDWIKYCWLSEKDVCLQAYRNSKKTTSILVVGTIWRLLYKPDHLISIIRKSETGAISILQEIAKHYEGERLRYIYEMFFDTKFHLKDYNQKKINLPTKSKITKEYNIEAYGKGGNITGAHFNEVCIDDIVTEKDRYSRAERESTKNYIRELTNIKTIDGHIIATGTPWHPEDAFKVLPEPKKYPLNSVPDDDFTPEKINEIQSQNTGSLFACNYMLKHISDTDQLIEPVYKPWNPALTCKAYLDPAYTGNCTTALTLLQTQGNDFVVKGYVWRMNITDLYIKITDICKEHNCIVLYCEANGDHGLSYNEIRKTFPLAQSKNEGMNKHYKIQHYIKLYSKRILFDYECMPEYIEQITYYEDGTGLVDAPDSLSSLLREIGNADTDKPFGFVKIKESGYNP